MEIEDELNDINYVVGNRKKSRHIQPSQSKCPEEFVFDANTDFRVLGSEKKMEKSLVNTVSNSWILMALGAMLCFASANLLINEISPLGIDAIDYYNSGALVFCILYMIVRVATRTKATVVDDQVRTSEYMLGLYVSEYRSLFYKRNGKFDTRIVVLIVMASFLTCSMFLSVSFTYAMAGQIGLNIGLAQTVWGTTPFFGALLDRLLHNVIVPKTQVVGMLLMVICVSLISFQHLIFGHQDGQALGIDGIVIEENSDQGFLSVFMFAMTYCVIMALLVMVQKHASVLIKVNPMDFVTAYFFLTMLVSQVYGLYSFKVVGREFNWHYFWIGSGASLLMLFGQYFVNLAVATENPIGPIQAILSSQAILITGIQVIHFEHKLNIVQVIAFVLGMTGAFVLVIPDNVKATVNCLLCREEPEDNQPPTALFSLNDSDTMKHPPTVGFNLNESDTRK